MVWFGSKHMTLFFNIAQIVLAVILTVLVLLQQKGSGLGAAFGGGGNVAQTRRGPEKFLFNATIVVIILFLGVAFTRILLA